MLKQCVLAVLMVLAGGLLLSNDGGGTDRGLTVAGVTIDVPFAGITVEARRAVFRGCSGGYVEATKQGWIRTRNGIKRGTVRYCKKPPAPKCAWNETLHWRSGWVCVPRPGGNGIPGSKSDGFAKNPKKIGPPDNTRKCPNGRTVPYGQACGEQSDMLISFSITRPTGL